MLKEYINCNIWRVAVLPSYMWDARFLKVKEHIWAVVIMKCQGKDLRHNWGCNVM
jgi:hypothetical protein